MVNVPTVFALEPGAIFVPELIVTAPAMLPLPPSVALLLASVETLPVPLLVPLINNVPAFTAVAPV
jgi:hypothetical protein